MIVGSVLLFFAGVLAFSAGAGAWFFAARQQQNQANIFNEQVVVNKGGKQVEKIAIAPDPNLILDADGRVTVNEDRVFANKTYRIQLQANQKYNFLVHGMFGMMPRLEIDDGAGQIAAREGNKDVLLPYIAKRTGEHTINVISRFGANNSAFALRIAQVVAEAPTPIDFAAQPSVAVQGSLRLQDPVFGEQPFDYGRVFGVRTQAISKGDSQQFPAISLPPEKRSLLTFLFVNAAGTISALSPHLIARANGVAGHVFLHQ
ncbi:MAG: hypothetical protein EXR98_20380, partial [Gemmataceae bacterium]|nr:hypothetical protein [Gemmataceae bacterium]